MSEPCCAATGCDEPTYDMAALDEQPYCAEHYPERSRYDTTLTDADVLCAVCHWNLRGTEFCEDIMQWRCPAHHPDNEGKQLIVDGLGNLLYTIDGPLPTPQGRSDVRAIRVQLALGLGLL